MSNFSKWQCNDFTDLDKLLELPCHKNVVKSRGGVDKYLGEHKFGTLAWAESTLINDSPDWDWIVIRDRVYNITNYISALRDAGSGKVEKDPDESKAAYLMPSLHSLIVNKINQDATEVYDKLFATDEYIDCMESQFFAGIVDTRSSPACNALNISMYALLIFIASILVLQCLCSLLYIARPHRTFSVKDGKSHVMIMVSCYNEGDKELRKTINSVLETKYPSDNKVMVVISDGQVTGRGERKSTPAILADILGFTIDENEDVSYSYTSIGALRENRANIHSGTYEAKGKSLKYVVIVKCGIESEVGGGRAGNRGKRDSQLLIQGLLNRVQHNRKLCDLDAALCRSFTTLRLPIDESQYLMTIDADTRVDSASIHHMVYEMNKTPNVLALCGETRVDNKGQSLVAMLQVFEYYTNHHMKKAFESTFGCVTCLPGCFTMYRVVSDDGRPLIAQDDVYSEYARNDIFSLHEKNLYHLGEDRMLTTLLLKAFPDMRLSFVPEAACWTIVPHTFWILLSQRRRWINSTFHNMLELLKVNTMCGVCCLSMKTIVLLDLIATMCLPASMLYAGYFIYLVFVTGEDVSTLMLILYAVILGVQVIVFLLRSRWDYLFWFLIFAVFGVPLFYFILPIYSFCKMDDFVSTHICIAVASGMVQKSIQLAKCMVCGIFLTHNPNIFLVYPFIKQSWGHTRQVQANKTKKKGGTDVPDKAVAVSKKLQMPNVEGRNTSSVKSQNKATVMNSGIHRHQQQNVRGHNRQRSRSYDLTASTSSSTLSRPNVMPHRHQDRSLSVHRPMDGYAERRPSHSNTGRHFRQNSSVSLGKC